MTLTRHELERDLRIVEALELIGAQLAALQDTVERLTAFVALATENAREPATTAEKLGFRGPKWESTRRNIEPDQEH